MRLSIKVIDYLEKKASQPITEVGHYYKYFVCYLGFTYLIKAFLLPFVYNALNSL